MENIKATALWISRLRGCMSGSYFSSEVERLTNVSTSMTSDSEGFVFAPSGKNKSHSSMLFWSASMAAFLHRSLKCFRCVVSEFDSIDDGERRLPCGLMFRQWLLFIPLGAAVLVLSEHPVLLDDLLEYCLT